MWEGMAVGGKVCVGGRGGGVGGDGCGREGVCGRESLNQSMCGR